MRVGIIIKGTSNDPFTATYSSDGAYVDDDLVLVEELKRRGHIVTPIRWDEPPSAFEGQDTLLIRSTWDFLFRIDEFRGWLDRCERGRLPLWNPPRVVRENISKRYLLRLSEAGVQTIPSLFVAPGETCSLRKELAARGWDEFIFKPAISGGAVGTVRGRLEEFAALEPQVAAIREQGDVLVQPFFPEICSAGEWSFVFFGSTFSHAVRKVPKAGEYREQATYGGSAVRDEPSPQLIEQAASARAVLAEGLPYARVDGIERDGSLFVNEVELIDPRLFFLFDDQAAARCADALEELA